MSDNHAAATTASYYWATLNDLVTLVTLKLPPIDVSRHPPAATIATVIAEIKSWTMSKPILTARDFRNNKTRDDGFIDIVDIQRHILDDTYTSCAHDLSREWRIRSRVNHTIGSGVNPWTDPLTADPTHETTPA